MAGAKPEWRLLAAGLAISAGLMAAAPSVSAITIELKDVAADRIERQRAAAEGRLPLPNTPEITRFDQRLADAGVKSGSPILMRVFKETSELEIWIEKGERFVLFATYPICHWSGTLGPKLREGDKQTPEGFYTIANRQLHHLGRWPRAINLGFPNAYDRAHDRNGSYILMHGGCSSVGCFAMTNHVIGEIYGLAKAAIRGGQRYIPMHVFPFRMTEDRMAEQAASPWYGFWSTLQAGYKSFERTGRPPRISVCEGAYQVEDAPPKSTAEATASSKTVRGKSRSDIMLGAIRTGCPKSPVLVTAQGKEAASIATGSISPRAR
jgi:murein L,D-transpeptidase YafK